MNKIITYSDEIELSEVRRLLDKGYEIICPRCKTKLEIPLILDKTGNGKLIRSISCPKNMNHVYTTMNYDRKGFWEELEKKWEEDRAKENKNQ